MVVDLGKVSIITKPIENFESMILLQMSCVITWAQKNQPQTSKKAARGPKHLSEAKKGMNE